MRYIIKPRAARKIYTFYCNVAKKYRHTYDKTDYTLCHSLQRYNRVHNTKTEDITKTAGYKEAMDDVKHGRVYHAESVDDMFKQILG